MSRRLLFLRLSTAALIAAVAIAPALTPAFAADSAPTPGKPIRFIVPYPPGGPTDLPQLPTMDELGVPIDFAAWHGISVAAGTPAPVIRRLNETLNAINAEPAARKRWEETGSPVIGGSPEQFGSLVLTESVRLGRVVKDSGSIVD